MFITRMIDVTSLQEGPGFNTTGEIGGSCQEGHPV